MVFWLEIEQLSPCMSSLAAPEHQPKNLNTDF